MGVVSLPCVSVTCDGCGYGYDEIGTNPRAYMEALRYVGWTGTYRKCYCPECSRKQKAVEQEESNHETTYRA